MKAKKLWEDKFAIFVEYVKITIKTVLNNETKKLRKKGIKLGLKHPCK